MVSSQGKKQSRTSRRPVLKTKRPKRKILSNHDVALQKKISKRGLGKKSPAPIGNIALKKDEDEKFKKKTKLFQKRKPKVKTRIPKDETIPGIVCISNLPHGFYEKQLLKYFSQFGDVNRVRLVRSKITGRSCGYAYVEFVYSVVAKIAAETMNNYLTYGKIIKCICIDYTEKKANIFFGGESCMPRNCPKVISRSKAIMKLNAVRSKEQTQAREKRAINNLNRKLKQLQALGVNLDLQLENVKIKKSKQTKEKMVVAVCSNDACVPADRKEDKVIFEADQSDDEITIKTPPNTRKKLVKITPTSPANRLTGVAKGKSKSLKKTPRTKQPLAKKTPREEQSSAKTISKKGKDTPTSADVSPKKTPRTKQPLAKKTPREEQSSAKTLFKKGKDTPTSADVSPKKTPRTKQPLAKKTPREEQSSAKILFKKGKDTPTSANVSPKKTPSTKQPLAKKTPREEQSSAKTLFKKGKDTPTSANVSPKKTPRTKQPLAKKTPREEQSSAKTLFKKGKDTPTSMNVSVSASGKAHKVIKDKPKQQSAVSDKKRRKSVQGANESGVARKRKRRSL